MRKTAKNKNTLLAYSDGLFGCKWAIIVPLPISFYCVERTITKLSKHLILFSARVFFPIAIFEIYVRIFNPFLSREVTCREAQCSL